MNVCPQCGSNTPRVEVFGADDKDETIYEYTCHTCGHVWQQSELEQIMEDNNVRTNGGS